MRGVSVLLVLLLTGCSYTGLFLQQALYSWDAEVMGLNVHYRVVPDGNPHFGVAMLIGRNCTIVLTETAMEKMPVRVAAHEIGHCLDGAYLGWGHNGFGDAGCRWGAYYCSAKEGYAEGWARTYLAACGLARSPLRLMPGDGVECELPDPRAVTPDSFMAWKLADYY